MTVIIDGYLSRARRQQQLLRRALTRRRSHGVMDRCIDRAEWPLALALKADRLARRLWPGQVCPPHLRRFAQRAALTAAALTALVCTRAPAQALGGNEWVAGAALNVALRGPYIALAWRRPVPRVVLGAAISAGYELGIDVHGWSWTDWGTRTASLVVTEVLIDILVRRRH